MKARIFLGVLCAMLATCDIPLGKNGQYGTATIGVGYRLPDAAEVAARSNDGKGIVR